MKIVNNDLIPCFRGCVRFEEKEEYLFPIRFTEKQSEHFAKSDFLYPRSKMTAGVLLDLYTTTQMISFDVLLLETSRNYYSIDVYVDGNLCFNFAKENVLSHTEVSLSFPLKEGYKRVQIYFPCLFECGIKNFYIDDDAQFLVSKIGQKILFLGDSITHGYATKCTSLTYANILSRVSGAVSLNQAVAGDVFNEDNLDEDLPFDPDLIFVAYGTNDWWHGRDVSVVIKKYFDKLTKIYPHTQIYALLPIYRLDAEEKHIKVKIPFVDFREQMKEIISEYKNVTVVDTINFVPHFTDFYEDGYLHPNDLGFIKYAENLRKYI